MVNANGGGGGGRDNNGRERSLDDRNLPYCTFLSRSLRQNNKDILTTRLLTTLSVRLTYERQKKKKGVKGNDTCSSKAKNFGKLSTFMVLTVQSSHITVHDLKSRP